eukprot:176324-Pelagomonas_calceolata.AAC.1
MKEASLQPQPRQPEPLQKLRQALVSLSQQAGIRKSCCKAHLDAGITLKQRTCLVQAEVWGDGQSIIRGCSWVPWRGRSEPTCVVAQPTAERQLRSVVTELDRSTCTSCPSATGMHQSNTGTGEVESVVTP